MARADDGTAVCHEEVPYKMPQVLKLGNDEYEAGRHEANIYVV